MNEAFDKSPIRLTEGGASYARDLSLVRVDDALSVAAWIDDDRKRSHVALRSIRNDALGPVAIVPPVWGVPAAPRFCPCGHLFWMEFRGAEGRLFQTTMDDAMHATGHPAVLAGTQRVWSFACCPGPGSRAWVIVETGAPESKLLLIREADGGWDVEPVMAAGRSFRTRLALVCAAETVMGAWDEYEGGRYRVITMDLTSASPKPLVLPAPAETWESLGAAARADSGAWFAARCRERLVELDGGIAGRHSELVVALLEDDSWRDVAAVDIDHGLNPWAAGYTGARRFPHLAAGAESVLLLWEEKEDAATMDPAPARFCGLPVGTGGPVGNACVAADNVSMLTSEIGARAEGMWLASKTQTYHNEQHLPWLLHRVCEASLSRPRPTGLDSNGQAGAFAVRPIREDRPRIEEQNLCLFFGDIHLHSRLSGDVDGEQDELYHFARDTAKLDFCAFTENDFHRLIEPMSEAVWERNRGGADYFDDPGRFTVLLGWEYTKHAEPEMNDPVPNSHRCVLFPGGDGEVYRCWDDHVSAVGPADLCAAFQGRRVLLHHHHPPGFDFTDDTLERNIEVCSGWWNCMAIEEFRNSLHDTLRRGFRLGFFGGSDNHLRNPGLGGALAGVWATENTREGIFDALWNRRVFATTGLRPDLRFKVAGCFMGTETMTHEAPLVELSVTCEAPVTRVEIIRDGHIVYEHDTHRSDVHLRWSDSDCPPGDHFYYAHVLFAGAEYNPYWNAANAYGVNAWSSPVWVRVEAPSANARRKGTECQDPYQGNRI